MFKGNRKYIFFLMVCFSLLIMIQVLSPKPINWKLSYSSKDNIPYGTEALYNALPDVFSNNEIQSKNIPAYNVLNKNNLKQSNYLVINQVFKPDKLDSRELLKFAESGNSIFVAANYFEGIFTDTFKIKTDNFWAIDNYQTNGGDSTVFSKIAYGIDSVKLGFVSKHLYPEKKYIYTKGIEDNYFSSFDTAKVIVLGINQNKKANFIKIKHGKGNIFLSTIPEVFSNYHFVSDNHDYVYIALSYLPNQPVIWDEYYKVGNIKTESPFRVLFNNESLLYAYYLSLFALLIFMIIGVKRTQRIIPIIEPLQNTTLQFVDVVGTLYFQTGNHKNIADKKINYFLDFIRTNFQVKTTLYDDIFINRIANLSGIAREKVHELFYYFSDISIKTSITQDELIKLNKLIENFYKENKR